MQFFMYLTCCAIHNKLNDFKNDSGFFRFVFKMRSNIKYEHKKEQGFT